MVLNFTAMKLVSVIFIFVSVTALASATYWDDRAEMMSKESSAALGSSIILTVKELMASTKLMDEKWREIDNALNQTTQFLPSVHFFKAKPEIEKSEVFKIIQKLPKGASLHSHVFAMVSGEGLFNFTYYENLYFCNTNDNMILQFFFNSTDDRCDWKLVSVARQENPLFDNELKSAISLIVEDPATAYPDLQSVWNKFDKTFNSIMPMLTYKPVFQEYFYKALEELYEDNVMYVEIRSFSEGIYDADGRIYDLEETTGLYLETVEQFKRDHPTEFFNVRMICAPYRKVDNKTFEGYINNTLNLKKLYPDFIAGFDLVGQEDMGEPLSYFADQLVEVAGQLKFFFHAGETNWNGGVDNNLIDAVLLNSTRIGHGYSILKHLEVMRIIKERQIAIEINPISNQVLHLVSDLRDHNGVHLIAGGYPIVISSDDPGAWGAKGLSYDWYMAFMGMTTINGDLRVLKQLALNSLQFSAMEEEERSIALVEWEKKWDQFLDEILSFFA